MGRLNSNIVNYVIRYIEVRFMYKYFVDRNEYINELLNVVLYIARSKNIFLNAGNLRMLYDNFISKTVCPICLNVILTNKLFEHIAKHMNEKIYKCEICNETFFTYVTILRHLKNAHTDVVKYKIQPSHKPEMGSADRLLRDNLVKLTIAMLKNTCDVCLKFSKSSSNLHAHIRVHIHESN